MLLTEQENASGYFVARASAGVELDWHAVPVRELAVYLTGNGEIEASDGTIRPLDPGTIQLVIRDLRRRENVPFVARGDYVDSAAFQKHVERLMKAGVLARMGELVDFDLTSLSGTSTTTFANVLE